jgi:hypothetical protein
MPTSLVEGLSPTTRIREGVPCPQHRVDQELACKKEKYLRSEYLTIEGSSSTLHNTPLEYEGNKRNHNLLQGLASLFGKVFTPAPPLNLVISSLELLGKYCIGLEKGFPNPPSPYPLPYIYLKILALNGPPTLLPTTSTSQPPK